MKIHHCFLFFDFTFAIALFILHIRQPRFWSQPNRLLPISIQYAKWEKIGRRPWLLNCGTRFQHGIDYNTNVGATLFSIQITGIRLQARSPQLCRNKFKIPVIKEIVLPQTSLQEQTGPIKRNRNCIQSHIPFHLPIERKVITFIFVTIIRFFYNI